MVKLNDTSKGILGDSSKKIGTYSESTGGGTPLKKGEKLKDHPEAHRVSQPRDEDGQFTYNSVNGKELKYGPSRGTTVPPFLRGIKLTFCQPGTKLKIDGENGIKIKIMTIDMSVEQIVANCKKYIAKEGGFAGMGKGSSIDKKGRKSEEEKSAAPGQIGYVDPKKLSDSTQKLMIDEAKKYEKNNSSEEIDPEIWTMFTPGFKAKTDVIADDGSIVKTGERYGKWYKRKEEEKEAAKMPTISVPTPKPVSSTPKPAEVKASVGASTTDTKKGVLSSMGLSGDDIAESKPITLTAEAASSPDYYEKNKETIDSMVSDLKSIFPGKRIKADDIIALIKAGKIDSMDKWKRTISSRKTKK